MGPWRGQTRWFRLASTCASRWNRASRSGSSAKAYGLLWGRTGSNSTHVQSPYCLKIVSLSAPPQGVTIPRRLTRRDSGGSIGTEDQDLNFRFTSDSLSRSSGCSTPSRLSLPGAARANRAALISTLTAGEATRGRARRLSPHPAWPHRDDLRTSDKCPRCRPEARFCDAIRGI